eukprot:12274730-Alexandrium_andersonii.AAC.1
MRGILRVGPTTAGRLPSWAPRARVHGAAGVRPGRTGGPTGVGAAGPRALFFAWPVFAPARTEPRIPARGAALGANTSLRRSSSCGRGS